ncbi:alpha/beta hydrolase [Streptomyces sp. NRRL B-24484]|uniref:alpha/beta hydrolase n=1 Tax=Streptomyces sp. NRRL B-24484 TaxID=1463833 RepID=UPI000694F37E|nr:alpha/beta hydrolase [Streptomyces sp. NRRL B-24484]
MDTAALAAARPGELPAAAAAYGALAAALERHHDAWARQTAGPVHGSGWQGRAADLAGAAVDRATGRLQAAWVELTLVQETLRQAAEAFAVAQAALPGDPAGAVALAERADAAAAERLAALAATARDGRALTPAAAVAGLGRLSDPWEPLNAALRALLPPPGAGPEQVAAWWRGLAPGARAALTEGRPELVGALDGLPARDRDRANRLQLSRLLEHPDVLPGPVREGLRAVAARLAGGDPAGGGPLLLVLGAEGQGRAVLSYGDPDTADDVAVYVPGFGTDLAAAGRGDAERAERIRTAAAGCGGGRTTAAMVWLGYDAPPNEGLDLRSVQVAGDARAKDGAADLNRFLGGLRAARPGEPAHVTAVGHSYGSLVVGLAARQDGAGMDDVVLVGSPGAGVDRADALKVGADHVYVGVAEHDPVGRLPAGTGVAGRMLLGGPAAAVVGQVAGPDELWFGRDPADTGFGARRFEVAPGDPGHPFDSHSAYFDAAPDGPSASLANIGRVVAGRGTETTAVPPR